MVDEQMIGRGAKAVDGPMHGVAGGRKEAERVHLLGGAALEALEGRSVPQWLEIDKDSFEGTVKAMPTREDITLPIQEQLIVELYSR